MAVTTEPPVNQPLVTFAAQTPDLIFQQLLRKHEANFYPEAVQFISQNCYQILRAHIQLELRARLLFDFRLRLETFLLFDWLLRYFRDMAVSPFL